MKITLDTKLGKITGEEVGGVRRFLGIRYGRANRFEYATEEGAWQGELDATHFGDGCPQTRTYIDQTKSRERRFYYREFRENESYTYSEDCLNLNVWTNAEKTNMPVAVWIHGGGFNSGSNCEKYIDGSLYAKNGIVFVSINYRVGVLGYACFAEAKKDGMEGNFGLSDQLLALRYIKHNIASFGGNPDDITVLGQSAGAISITALCFTKECEGLIQKAVMMSGGGIMPKLAQPKKPSETESYWLDYMKLVGAKSLAELKETPLPALFEAFEEQRRTHKQNQYNCMPVVDGVLLKKSFSELEREREWLKIPYLLGTTENDLMSLIFYQMANSFAVKQEGRAFTYFFSRDLPGDDNGSFHSSDLWYALGAMKNCWRPFEACDYRLAEEMSHAFMNFIRSGNPNGDNGKWQAVTKRQRKPMCFSSEKSEMKKPNFFKLLQITLKNEDPKYPSEK